MFNKETEYALRGLVYIKLQNLKKRIPGTNEVAQEIEAPPFFTAKILQRLVRAGLLRSIKGKGGGFYFDEKEPDLTLKKLISATGGETTLTSCGFGLAHCDDSHPCPLHEKYGPIRNALNKLVSEETIGTLANKIYSDEFTFISNRKKQPENKIK